MDRQDAPPHRPSLLAAPTHRTPSLARGRILADMADLGPRARRGASRGWRLSLLGVGLIAVTAAGAWWLANEPVRARAPLALDAASTPPTRSGAATTAMAPSVPGPLPVAARILEDPAAPGGPPAVAAVAANPFAPPRTAIARAAHPRPSAPADRHRRAAVVAPPASRAASAPRRAIETVEPDLLATLLGNINRATPAEPRVGLATRPAPLSGLTRPQRGSDQDALDALVRQLRARDKAAGAAAAAVATARHPRTAGRAAAAPVPARSAMVQAQLRQCPRANTTAGLRCRQKVCAQFSGRDPACPRG